jgi:hypothetical protein
MIRSLTDILRDAQEVLLRVHKELPADSMLRSRCAMVYIDILQYQIDEEVRAVATTGTSGFAQELAKTLDQ